MRTKIFVMTHKKFHPPHDEIYIPLQVGRVLGEDLGYLGDDTGETISARNPFYGELTGMYWLWKNYQNVDLIGICHYRRYFFDDSGKLMTQQQYETELLEADILVSDPIYAPKSYLEYYGDAHNVNDMLLAGKIIQKLYPNDYSAFEQVMRGRKYYFGNLCVMKKQLFDDYCSWLFSVFFEMEELIDVSNYDEYHKRVFGFLSEELLLVYITARKLRVKEGHIGITSEKAETIEFKLGMGQLVKQGAFTEARKLFYDYLKIRPDVQLELSDITNEIPDIELILFILEKEQEQGIDGLYDLSHNLKELVDCLRKLKEIIYKKKCGEEITSEEKAYIRTHRISETTINLVKANI